MFEIDFKKPIHVYFVGIGGISMSGLAEILLSEGFQVSGSDMKQSPLCDKLSSLGASIYYGQSVSHIDESVDLVVFTAAIHEDNPELVEKILNEGTEYSRNVAKENMKKVKEAMKIDY